MPRFHAALLDPHHASGDVSLQLLRFLRGHGLGLCIARFYHMAFIVAAVIALGLPDSWLLTQYICSVGASERGDGNGDVE